MKTIALVEDSWTGHRPTYLKLFNKVLLDIGYEVITFCPNPQELKTWLEENYHSKLRAYQVFEFSKPPSTQLPLQPLNGLFNAINLWRKSKIVLDRTFQRLGKSPDLTFFCVLDSYLAAGLTHHWVDRFFSYQWSGLYFNPRHMRLNSYYGLLLPAFMQPHAILYSSYCPAVALLDEGLTERFQEMLPGKIICNFPDCTDTSKPDFSFPLIEQIKEKARGRKIVGLLGSQSKRKGIFTLVEVARKMKSEPFFFLFAGNLYPKTFTREEHSKLLEILSLNLENCLFYWEVVPEPRFNALVTVCDILFAAYEKFPHSSNMLNKSSIFRKPIIVSKNYCMEERVKKFRTGVSINESNVEEGIKAIQDLANNPFSDPNFEGYIDTHSNDKLYPAFQKILSCLKT